MTLLDIVAQLNDFDETQTIYAREPWNEGSEAVVAPEDESGTLVPPRLQANGFSYFIEVFIAKDFLHDWRESTSSTPSDREACARLIQYARYDA